MKIRIPKPIPRGFPSGPEGLVLGEWSWSGIVRHFAEACGATLRTVTSRTTPIEQRLPRPAVVGVVNVTPDSFSDGGDFVVR